MKVRCVEPFLIKRVDDDGRLTEKNDRIHAGEEYKVSTSAYRFVGGPDTVRLESAHGWLEILPETFEKYFETVEE